MTDNRTPIAELENRYCETVIEAIYALLAVELAFDAEMTAADALAWVRVQHRAGRIQIMADEERNLFWWEYVH